MTALNSFRFVRVGLVLGAGSLLASSCVVDKSGLVFDDDEYQAALGSGGEGGDTGTGGEASASGGLGGNVGGDTGSGGMGGSDAVCEPNEMQCNGQQVELCSGNEWIPIGGPCPNACVGGICTGVCSPDSDECLSAIQTQHCNDVGEWEDEFCEFACVAGTCGGVCRPGERDCSGDTRTLCGDDGQWVEQDTCAGDCEAGVCVGACPVGETQCSGDAENPIQITCDAATWEDSTQTPCDFICDETLGTTGECGGECVPFSSTCASPTQVQTCDSTANYGDPVDCTYVCDPDTDACGGECVPGTEKCTGDTVQTCNGDGEWVSEATCSGASPVCLVSGGQASCVECAPGAKMCSPTSNALLTCTASGAWPNSGTACPVVKTVQTLCWEERGVPACVPPSEVECPSICTKGCPAGCIDSDTRWSCVSGAPKATNCTLLQTCNSGVCK